MSRINFDELLAENGVTEDDERVSDLVEDHNLELFNYRRPHAESSLYICKCCHDDTSIEDSFSDQGQFLHCIRCVEKQASQEGKSVSQWIKENVWMREL